MREEAEGKFMLRHLNNEQCKIGQVHPGWYCHSDPVEVAKAGTTTYLLVQCSVLYNSHCSRKEEAFHLYPESWT